MRDTDIYTDPEDIKNLLGQFLNDMRVSGYGIIMRADVIKGVLKRSKQMEEEIRGGTRIRCRNGEQIVEQKGQN